MAKEDNTIEWTEIEDPSQIGATRYINKHYHSDAAKMLHQAQEEFNQQLQKERENDHRNYRDIEKEAAGILAHAQKEGAQHIVARHGKSATFFYASGNTIKRWYNNKINTVYVHPEKEIPKTNTKAAIFPEDTFISVFSYWQGSDQFLLLLGNTLHDIDNKKRVRAMYRLKFDQGKNKFTLVGGPNNPDYLDFHDMDCPDDSPREVYITRSFIQPLGGAQFEFGSFSINDLFNDRPTRICYDAKYDTQNKPIGNAYYILYNKVPDIRKVDFSKSPSQSHEVAVGKTDLSLPIDLDYYHVNNSLIIQDEGKMEIGVHQMNDKHFWIAFKARADKKLTVSHIPVPASAMPSGKSFTVSFILKSNFDDPAVRTRPDVQTALNMYINTEDELVYCCKTGDDVHEASFSIKSELTRIGTDIWFHVAWQKEGKVFRFFIDGILVHTTEAPEEVGVGKKPGDIICIATPGYVMAELRFWSVARSQKEILRWHNTWLVGGDHEGLEGYWRLDAVPLEYLKKGETEPRIIKWPDLSGNNLHLPENMTGEKSSTAIRGQIASTPFAKIIPIYPFKVVHQGLELDKVVGEIHWIDEGADGRFYMMSGSALGHTKAVALFEIDCDGGFGVMSAVNSVQENLIEAHYQREQAMRNAIMKINAAQNASHEQVKKAHAAFHDDLVKHQTGSTEVNNTELYNTTHSHWLQLKDQMHVHQEDVTQAVRKKKQEVLNLAKEITAKAKTRSRAIRSTKMADLYAKKEAENRSDDTTGPEKD